MNLHIRSKEEKKEGKFYSDLNITRADFRKQVDLYHSGKISAHALAFDVINALFERDFTPGAHWEIGTATLDELEDGEMEGQFECFGAEKEAVWDWKDIYSVATAKATIKISSGDIYIDEYSYYVAG